MQWHDAVEEYLRDQQQAGRINSMETARKYRRALSRHAEDTPEGPVSVVRGGVKRTLARWPHPNTRALEHSVLVSFYDWMVAEGLRGDNPARQVPRTKTRKPEVYRLTRSEVQAMIAACETPRERRVILLGVYTGARATELRSLQGRHFARPGFVWFSADIAKGKTERWVPVPAELAHVAGDIRATAQSDHYVIRAYHGGGLKLREPTCRIGYHALRHLVVEVGRRAGIAACIHPHLLRHAYGDHVARHAGLRVAQALMGHASVQTTASTYVDRPALDELAVSVRGLRYSESHGERVGRFERQMRRTSATGTSVTKYHTATS
jgi:integrase/recombinase XerD